MDSIADMDKYLSAAGASWDSNPAAGKWIAPLLDEPGASLGHAVPAGYDEYAVVPIPRGGELLDYEVLGALIGQLRASTGDQIVHTALWDGWGWLYDHDDDPRTAPGAIVFFVGEHSEEDLRQAQEELAETRVALPNVSPLRHPSRNYFLWSGPLDSVMALEHNLEIPSMIWPEDRSWFIGAPIYTDEIAIGANSSTMETVLSSQSLQSFGARRADRDEFLQIDD